MNSEIQIYTTADGNTNIDVRFEDENVWLTQKQLAELFQTSKSNVSEHLKNIFEEGELQEKATVRKFRTVRNEGDREVSRQTIHYNLDAIISLGYRVKSQIATNFRIWASQRLKEYLVKGFTIDQYRLEESGGGNYWRDLLDTIRQIRTSEKLLYRQVLDLYATSVDYSPKAPESAKFFATVQNKLHYATHKQTAPEIIFKRADSTKDFMGLSTFRGQVPTLQEAKIAKNYLSKEELFKLERLVSAFFDLAEIKAMNRQKMYMHNWVEELDNFCQNYGEGVLDNAGEISRAQALAKAEKEFRKYEARTISPVEADYFKAIEAKIEDKIKKEAQND